MYFLSLKKSHAAYLALCFCLPPPSLPHHIIGALYETHQHVCMLLEVQKPVRAVGMQIQAILDRIVF